MQRQQLLRREDRRVRGDVVTDDFDSKALRIEGLTKWFGPRCPRCSSDDESVLERNYCPDCGTVYALRDLSLCLYEGEVLGVVGESGSGKSTILNCLYYDMEPSSGSAYLSSFEGGAVDVFSVSAQAKRGIRNSLLGKVYQNPLQGLKMRFSAVSNVAEKLIAAGGRNVAAMEERAVGLLAHVNIPSYRMREAPEFFSGGMQQRVQIAKALSNNPPVLLLDEVTTGLDLSVQAKVLDLVKQIQRELGIGMLLVSHDLGVVRMLADRTIVMLNGKVVEEGLTDQILEDPQEPYTQELVHSML
jgi:putative phosphonate transport system ATP-binding protein